jgi:3-hydroxyacyl-[acyl-carrier-protein] dehydratase
MLTGSFCTISRYEHQENIIKAILFWNESHDIFKGHFPGQPVVPGVCMIQLIKELLEQTFQKPIWLVNGTNIKFLNFIDPRFHQEVEVSIKYQEGDNNQLNVSAGLSKNETSFFKFNASYSLVAAAANQRQIRE